MMSQSESMPKKTRREKIVADLRRILGTSQPTPIIPEQKEFYALPKIQTTQPTSVQNLIPINYLKRDLTKTFVLAILAISLELVLYFWLG